MPIFTTDVDADGIATIAWDLPEKSMNILTDEGIADLDAAVDAALADPAVKGIVLTSAKPDFAAGMDLNVLAGMKEAAGADPAAGIFDGIMAMHRLLRKIERAGTDPKTLKGGKPVACALPGLAAGIEKLRVTETVILGPARQPGFDFATFQAAWIAFENART